MKRETFFKMCEVAGCIAMLVIMSWFMCGLLDLVFMYYD